MKFLLKNLELHLPEHNLLNGEKLFEEKEVRNLYESDRHLWIAEVKNKEVEIQISPSKVLAYSCECKHYENQNVCEHIAATLLALRQHISTIKSKKTTPKTRKKVPPKKLSTNSIFEYANQEDLIAFMKQYAKINRLFSLSLKARFASSVPMENSFDKYAQLIDSTINTYRNKDDTINYKGSLQILGISKQLLGQAKDEIALENYNEGYTILECLIKKITPILQKLDNNIDKIKAFVEASFMNIDKLLKSELAPSLKTKIRLFCLEEVSRSIYYENDFSIYFIHLLKTLSVEEKELREVKQVIDYELKKSEISPGYEAKLIVEKMKILNDLDDNDALQKLIEKNIHNADLIIAVVENIYEKGEIPKAKELAKRGLKESYTKTKRIQLESILLRIFIHENDSKHIAQLSKKLFLDTLNFKYFDVCKASSETKWKGNLNEIIDHIHSLPYSIKKRDTLAEIMANEGLKDELFNYMNRLGSLDLLRNYDKYLLPSKKKQLFELYHRLLTNYLDHHFGQIPSSKIKEVINHIHSIGEPSLANKLMRKLKSDYGDRPSLMNELKLL
jgi:hypothetical protein